MGKARKKRYCCSSMLKLFAKEGISLFSGHASFHHFPRKCPKEEETKVVVFLQNKTLQRRALSPALFPSLSFSFGTFPSPSQKKEREEREGGEREREGALPSPSFSSSSFSSLLRPSQGFGRATGEERRRGERRREWKEGAEERSLLQTAPRTDRPKERRRGRCTVVADRAPSDDPWFERGR